MSFISTAITHNPFRGNAWHYLLTACSLLAHRYIPDGAGGVDAGRSHRRWVGLTPVERRQRRAIFRVRVLPVPYQSRIPIPPGKKRDISAISAISSEPFARNGARR